MSAIPPEPPAPRRQSRRKSLLAAPIFLLLVLAPCSLSFLLLALGTAAYSGPLDEVSRRDYAIAGFKPPPRWELLPRDRPSYPQLLASASRGQGADRAVITLTAKRLAPGTTLQQFAQEANA